MEAAIARLDQSEAQFARDLDGELVVSQNAASLVRATMTVPGAAANVESVSGIAVIDSGSGLPDSAAGVGAIYTASRAEGVIAGDGVTIIRADHVETFLYEEGTARQLCFRCRSRRSPMMRSFSRHAAS